MAGSREARPARPDGNASEILLGPAAGKFDVVRDGDGYRVLARRPGEPRAQAGTAVRSGDWVRARGERNEAVVCYSGAFWVDAKHCDERGAPLNVDLFLRLIVARAAGADPDTRRAGVLVRLLGSQDWTSVEGLFVHRPDEQHEEWQVRLCMKPTDPGIVLFMTWYQDGREHTWFDDNGGQLDAVVWRPRFETIRHSGEGTHLAVSDEGVHGTLVVSIADLEYDKELELVCTTDGWRTIQKLGTGDGPASQWRWVRDEWGGFQQWDIEVDIPGSADVFEYAIVYRHGRLGIRCYEFWADNGQHNFAVRRGDQARL